MLLGISCLIILLLFLVNVPVVISLITGVLIYFIFSDNSPSLTILVQRLVGGVESYPLLAIPFFIVAGALMNYTGITSRLLRFAELATGRLPGGLAQVSVVLSGLMGGLNGSNLADAAMLTKLLYPEMRKLGYSAGFSTAILGASSLLTPLIPPGIAMILYGYIGNVSIGRLFLAGIVPAIITGTLLMITVHIISKKKGYRPSRTEPARMGEFLKVSKDAFLALLMPIIIIVGIRFGIFTPTEAGAIAILYSLVIGILFYREMKLSDLKLALMESLRSILSIMLIIAAGSTFGWILTWERVPHMAAEFVTSWIDSPLSFLLVINVFLLIMGMFMEGNVLIIILTPLLLPLATSYGIDPVHFGMVFLFNLFIGTLTPPFGTVMFTTCSLAGVKIEEFVKEAIPFYIVLLIVLVLITYIPSISLWLPNLLMN